jgi:hypothetical protein
MGSTTTRTYASSNPASQRRCSAVQAGRLWRIHIWRQWRVRSIDQSEAPVLLKLGSDEHQREITLGKKILLH